MSIHCERKRWGRWCLYAALLGFLLSRTAGGVIDLDLFHEMALAREALFLGYVPWQDSFAYTPTIEIVVHHEWGMGLIALVASRLVGGSGIILIKFLLIVGLAVVTWNTARARRASPIVIGLFAALAIVLSDFGFATVRAQMFSYLFAALFLRWFDQDRRGQRSWMICTILLLPVWVNIHGGCIVGAALLAVHWFEQLIRREPHWHLFALGLLLIPLTAINPWGWNYHAYLLHALTMPRPAIAEWAPLWDPENRQQLVHFLLSLLPLMLILKQFRWRQLPGVLIVLVTAFASMKSNRFLPFYAIAYVSYLSWPFSQIPLGRDLRRWWWRFQPAWCGVLGCLAIVLVAKSTLAEPWRLQVASHPLPHQGKHLIYPVGAVNYLLKQKFQGNVMTPYDWGSYVMWRMSSAAKVSFDSRYEVAYPTSRMAEDDCFYNATAGWEDVLRKYPTDLILVRSDLKIVDRLREHPDWKKVYRDPQFLLFARTETQLPVFETDIPAENGRFP